MLRLPIFIVAVNYLYLQAVCGDPIGLFDRLECSNYDSNYIELITCWLTPDTKGQLNLNTELILKTDLSQIMCNFKLKVNHNGRNFTYVSTELDICKALSTVFTNPLLTMLAAEFYRVSNFPVECPLKQGVRYVMKNFTINSKYIPKFAPIATWMTFGNFHFNNSNKNVLEYITVGRVVHQPNRPKNNIFKYN